MSIASDLAAAMASNATAIAGYALTLANESVTPLEDYEIDGEKVSPSVWRLSISEQIQRLTKANEMLQIVLNQQAPYFVSTRVVV